MAYVILHNNFSNDPILIRLARLFFLSNNLPPFIPELALPPNYETWALNAYSNFNVATSNQNVQRGEKEEAFRLSDVAMETLGGYYAILKDVLLARYAPSDVPVCYGVKGVAPESKQGIFDVAQKFILGHNERVAVGDPLVLPDVMLNKLIGFRNDADASWKAAYSETGDVETATEEMRALYDADTKMLRIIYNWICAMWRRDDPRLIEIGFVQRTYEGGGGTGGEVPAVPIGFELKWLEPTLKIKWDSVDGATSYQLAYRKDTEEAWEELYSGNQKKYNYDPPEGKRFYRVRARNADGYGEWSEILDHEVGDAPVVGEWPEEPQGLYAIHHDVPVIFNEVGYNVQVGADSYRLKRVKVLITDPDPADADMPVDNFIEELGADPYADADILPGDKCAYWACGVKAGVEGAWAGPVICVFPA